METIQLNLYDFAELNEKAKAKALKEFAYLNVEDDWYSYTIDDFKTVCETIGITVDTSKTYFRGFYSQDDGSCFTATVNIPQLIRGIKIQNWKTYAPKLELAIDPPQADSRVILLIQNESFDIAPKIIGAEQWNSVTADLNYYLPYTRHNYKRIEAELDKLETGLQAIADKLNQYLYKSLEAEYEHQTKTETIIVTLEVNGYQFTADGVCATRLKNLKGTT